MFSSIMSFNRLASASNCEMASSLSLFVFLLAPFYPCLQRIFTPITVIVV